VLGIFFLGVLTRNVSQRAALTGLLGGIITITTVVLVNNADLLKYFNATDLMPYWTKIAWPWYSLIGSAATFGCGTLAALLPGFRETRTV